MQLWQLCNFQEQSPPCNVRQYNQKIVCRATPLCHWISIYINLLQSSTFKDILEDNFQRNVVPVFLLSLKSRTLLKLHSKEILDKRVPPLYVGSLQDLKQSSKALHGIVFLKDHKTAWKNNVSHNFTAIYISHDTRDWLWLATAWEDTIGGAHSGLNEILRPASFPEY